MGIQKFVFEVFRIYSVFLSIKGGWTWGGDTGREGVGTGSGLGRGKRGGEGDGGRGGGDNIHVNYLVKIITESFSFSSEKLHVFVCLPQQVQNGKAG